MWFLTALLGCFAGVILKLPRTTPDHAELPQTTPDYPRLPNVVRQCPSSKKSPIHPNWAPIGIALANASQKHPNTAQAQSNKPHTLLKSFRPLSHCAQTRPKEPKHCPNKCKQKFADCIQTLHITAVRHQPRLYKDLVLAVLGTHVCVWHCPQSTSAARDCVGQHRPKHRNAFQTQSNNTQTLLKRIQMLSHRAKSRPKSPKHCPNKHTQMIADSVGCMLCGMASQNRSA